MKRTASKLGWIFILTLLLFNSCTDESQIESITIDNNAILLRVNDSDTLDVKIKPSGIKFEKINWISENPNVAVVNSFGIVTAIKPGVASIIARSVDSNLKDTCIVTVVKISNYTTLDGLIGNSVRTISADSLGNIWFGTFNGVSKFDGTNWISYTETNGLVKNPVSCIFFDKQNTVWFGTTGGVSKFDGTNWKNYTKNDGLADNQVYAITIDHQENNWFGTYNGLSKFDGTNWTTYSTGNGLLGYYNWVFGLITDKTNYSVWAITHSGISIYNGNSWTGYSTSNSNFGSTIYGIFVDKYNNKWLATIDGIFKLEGSKWIKSVEDSDNPLGFAHDIIFDNQDNVWFTTSHGLFKYDGKNIATFENENFQLINKTEINDIEIDKEENIWIAKTFEGVYKLETK